MFFRFVGKQVLDFLLGFIGGLGLEQCPLTPLQPSPSLSAPTTIVNAKTSSFEEVKMFMYLTRAI